MNNSNLLSNSYSKFIIFAHTQFVPASVRQCDCRCLWNPHKWRSLTVGSCRWFPKWHAVNPTSAIPLAEFTACARGGRDDQFEAEDLIFNFFHWDCPWGSFYVFLCFFSTSTSQTRFGIMEWCVLPWITGWEDTSFGYLFQDNFKLVQTSSTRRHLL